MDDELDVIFSAYEYKALRKAFIRAHKQYRATMLNLASKTTKMEDDRLSDWTLYKHDDGIPPPENHEWMELNGSMFIRPIKNAPEPPAVIAQESTIHNDGKRKDARLDKKTDLSMKPTDKKCPLCGEVMAWEPICPGCKLGRQGFKGRYVCMADFDHTYYMLQEGLDLPNR